MSDLESDPNTQHDAPAEAGLVQPEVDGRHDSVVVEGDDVEHVLPPTELDPYTPELAAGHRPFAAMWIAIVILLGLLALVIYAAVA